MAGRSCGEAGPAVFPDGLGTHGSATVRPAKSGRVDNMKRPVSLAQTSILRDFWTTTTSIFCEMHHTGGAVVLKGRFRKSLF